MSQTRMTLPILFDSPESLLSFMAAQGGEAYFGESVTVLQHSLQAAFFSRNASEPDTLVAASLLHDLGHLLHQQGEDAAESGYDARHEELACQLLAGHLPPAVTEPIRLHVAAKRYLCFVKPEYLGELSPSSSLSLSLQGGPMSAEEAAAFLAGPFADAALSLRNWDDAAKIPGLPVPPVETYLPVLKTLWRQG